MEFFPIAIFVIRYDRGKTAKQFQNTISEHGHFNVSKIGKIGLKCKLLYSTLPEWLQRSTFEKVVSKF